jgi:competence protein ComEA
MLWHRHLFVIVLFVGVLSFSEDASAKVLRSYTGKLNINTASAADFARLPAIGDVMSFRIVKEREHRGHFTAIKDIASVKGVSLRIYEGVKEYLALEGENNLQIRIDLNTITRSLLLGLPGMTSGEARSILMFRKTRPFTRVEDLLQVPGIGEKRMQELSEWVTVVQEPRR